MFRRGLPCWGSELISAEEREQHRQKLDDLKGFLEGLQAFNTAGEAQELLQERHGDPGPKGEPRPREAGRGTQRPRSRTHAIDRLPGDRRRRVASSRPVATRDGDRSEPHGGQSCWTRSCGAGPTSVRTSTGRFRRRRTTTRRPISTCTRKPAWGSTKTRRRRSCLTTPGWTSSRSWLRGSRFCPTPP